MKAKLRTKDDLLEILFYDRNQIDFKNCLRASWRVSKFFIQVLSTNNSPFLYRPRKKWMEVV